MTLDPSRDGSDWTPFSNRRCLLCTWVFLFYSYHNERRVQFQLNDLVCFLYVKNAALYFFVRILEDEVEIEQGNVIAYMRVSQPRHACI